MIDMLDMPPSYAPVVIAQASQAKPRNASTARTIGVCHLIENPPNPPGSAVNTMDPTLSAWTYLKRRERPTPNWLTVDEYKAARVSVLQDPAHGLVKDEGDGGYRYAPTPGYYGQDRATLLVEIGGLKIKLMYFFKVMQGVPGGTEGNDPYNDKKLCPNGMYWKISLNPDDPSNGMISFQRLK